jgi:iron complex transport system permease protein
VNLRSLSPRFWILGLALALVSVESLRTGPLGTAGFDALWNAFAPSKALSGVPAGTPELRDILLQLRAPRLLLGILAGADLALAGLILQTLFLNPLADAYVVGVSSGASLGAVSALCLGFQMGAWGINPVSGCAFAGAMLALLAVVALTQRGRHASSASLLLGGLCVGALAQSVSTLLLIRSGNEQLRSALGWLMGSLAYRDWADVRALLPASLLGIAGAWAMRDTLNLLAMGSASAHHLGIDVRGAHRRLVAIAALLASAAVSVCGLIGFIGLVVPNLLRLWSGPNHRSLIPLSLIGGALLLTLADVLNRRSFPAEELPVGILTGVLGALFLLGFMQRRAAPRP